MTDERWQANCDRLEALLRAPRGARVDHPFGAGPIDVGARDIAVPVRGPSENPRDRARELWLAAGRAGLLAADAQGERLLEATATVQSALAGAGPNPAVLIFTVASVQEFVAAARRTQDLWFGSYLFSWLVFRAMWAVAEETGWDALILPTLQRQPLAIRECDPSSDSGEHLIVANFPNIFTALVSADEAERLARTAEAALWSARDAIFDEVRVRVEEGANSAGLPLAADANWKPTWDRQRTHFLQPNVFWVTVPLVGGDYESAALRAARLLTSRKSLRQFFQPKAGEWGEKCTLCGLRSALCLHGRGDYPGVRQFWEQLAQIDRSDNGGLKLLGRIRRGERLCAVCITKRLALEAFFQPKLKVDYHLFPSTATVATAGFTRWILRRLAQPTVDAGAAALERAASTFVIGATDLLKAPNVKLYHESNALPRVRQAASEARATTLDPPALARLDGQWLYRDSWTRQALESELRPDVGSREAGRVLTEDERQRLSHVRSALDALLKAANDGKDPTEKRSTGRKPSAYFAIVALDGDEMGKWIRGRQGFALNLDYHANLAMARRDFSLFLARVAVEELATGKLVYSGGDDVLALFPVEEVLQALRVLRGFFRGSAPAPAPDLPGFKLESGTVVDAASGERYLTMGPKADLSAGVLIAHHSHPLAHAVEEAQRVEREAKDIYNRRAVAVRLIKRAGSALTTGLPWSWSSDGRDALAHFAALVDGFREKKLSPSLAHDMRREGTPHADVQGSILRYLLERRPEALRNHEVTDRVTDLLARLQKEADAIPPRWPRNTKRPWAHAADLFELGRFIASESVPG